MEWHTGILEEPSSDAEPSSEEEEVLHLERPCSCCESKFWQHELEVVPEELTELFSVTSDAGEGNAEGDSFPTVLRLSQNASIAVYDSIFSATGTAAPTPDRAEPEKSENVPGMDANDME